MEDGQPDVLPAPLTDDLPTQPNPTSELNNGQDLDSVNAGAHSTEVGGVDSTYAMASQQDEIILRTSVERQWQTLAGHSIDHTR